VDEEQCSLDADSDFLLEDGRVCICAWNICFVRVMGVWLMALIRAEGPFQCRNTTIQNNDIGPCGSSAFQMVSAVYDSGCKV